MEQIKNWLEEYNKLLRERETTQTCLKNYTDTRQVYIKKLERIEHKLRYFIDETNPNYSRYVQAKEDSERALMNIDNEYGSEYSINLHNNLMNITNKIKMLKDSYIELVSSMLKEEFSEDASEIFDTIIAEKMDEYNNPVLNSVLY